MATLFRTGDGSETDTIIVALELVNNDWFKRALIQALTLMCDEINWTQVGDATVDFARDKSNEIVENMVIDLKLIPVGTIEMWLTGTPPNGWLICDGASVLKATYPALYSLWGDFFGSVDSTHFNLPDMRERSPMGAGTFVGLGLPAGSNTHNILVDELPAHTHAPKSPATVYAGRHSGGSTDWIRATAGATFDQMTETGFNETLANAMAIVHEVRGVNFIVFTGE